jgi:hypothetical protein
MTSAQECRQQAARLLNMAMAARDKGDAELAEMFTAGAMRYIDRATQAEAAEPPPPFSPEARQPAAQQQQQSQPKKEEE